VGARSGRRRLRRDGARRTPLRRRAARGARRARGHPVVTRAPAPAFDEIIHSPVRLRICGVLRRVAELEFAVIRDALGVADAHLSKNLRVLADSGYLTVRKESSTARTD